ncbi:MAG: redoxin domain-containing protein [Candidatus Acidiferrales bacterium]
MKKTRWLVLISACAAVTAVFSLSAQAIRIGEPAPDFTHADTHGVERGLSEYHGQYVVLEWTNRGCPYTRKQYESGNMQRLQRQWTARGVIWLTVISSAPGKQGYMTAGEENTYLATEHSSPTAVLLDPSGKLGHLYGAKTTPHMFVINPQGVLIYDGAIDNKPTTDIADVPGATNYVSLALKEAMAGQRVSSPVTRPYGCSVKYAQ